MNKINFQGFRDDYVFLQNSDKFLGDFRSKSGTKSNFLLHPKRITSDSECSTVPNSAKTLRSRTTIRGRNDSARQSVPMLEIGDGDEAKKVTGKASKQATSNLTRTVSSRIDLGNSSFDKKFRAVTEKNLKLLNSIRLMLVRGAAPPDGEEDYQRKLKRIQEFSSRFSRIYIYPLLRQTNELSLPHRLTPAVVNQKIVGCHQLILQGLQAYHNYFPSSVGKCSSDKLKTLLDQAVYLCQIQDLLKQDQQEENEEFVNALRTNLETLIEATNSFNLASKEEPCRKPETSVEKVSKIFKVSGAPKKQKKSSLRSVYGKSASFRNDLQWRKAVELLAKKRFNVKSRYKTAGFKHRPPVQKPHIVSLPSKQTLFPKLSSDALKNTPLASPVNEDRIETMVEATQPRDNGQELLNHDEDISVRQLQLVRDSDRGGDAEGAKQAVEVLRRYLGIEGQFLDKVAEEIALKTGESQLKFVERKETENEARKNRKEPVITVSGAKNAKLICIRDDNSVVEDKIDNEVMTEKQIESTSSQTNLKNETRSSIKISRLPKSDKKVLRVLPRDYAINVIQYKLEYHKYSKHNHMYRKSTSVQPWVLMGKISDEILDHVLLSVTGELEVNEILENLCRAEFEY